MLIFPFDDALLHRRHFFNVQSWKVNSFVGICLNLVLFCFEYRDLDEVIRRANKSQHGLAAGVFTRNIDTANTLTRALRVGSVWINCYFVFDAAIPFGGYKMSGHGREKGIYSLRNYLQVKAVVQPLKNPAWL